MKWFSSKHILDVLYEPGKLCNFSSSIGDAFDNDIIRLHESKMIKKLAAILQGDTNQLSHIIATLKICCEYAESFKACGVFLNTFCGYLDDSRPVGGKGKAQLIIDGNEHIYDTTPLQFLKCIIMPIYLQ